MTTRLRVQVTRRAANDILAAAEWWAANRPAAPEALREELQRAFELISVQPGVGARARNTKLQGVRRLHLSRVRYHLYYRQTSSAVEVLAFWHGSRGADPGV